MTGNLKVPSYSARVRMELRLNGSVLTISHLGPDYLILTEPVDHPPTQAEIAMSVDGNESRWAVQLPAGLSAASRRTSILPCRQGFNGLEEVDECVLEPGGAFVIKGKTPPKSERDHEELLEKLDAIMAELRALGKN